ncbi:hypothetical protein [Nonomuraea sp. NPDC049625]
MQPAPQLDGAGELVFERGTDAGERDGARGGGSGDVFDHAEDLRP